VGNLAFWIWFWLWRQGGAIAAGEEAAASDPSVPHFFHSLVNFVFGGLFIVAGLAAYATVISTTCLTFDFSRPVWRAVKVRVYIANIIVLTLFMVGGGFIAAGLLVPLLVGLGLSRGVAFVACLFGSMFVLQIAAVWILLWAPLERRLISKRLAARGITPQQMAEGVLVGLSDPSKSSLRKFAAIEEDVGMLWVDAQRLVYFGDTEHFVLTPDQILAVERKTDAVSTTALSGTAHVILRVRQSDGKERPLRLHTEGIWTMGGKRRAMDALAARIAPLLASATMTERSQGASPTTPPSPAGTPAQSPRISA
jgi:hypothetical protein